MIGKAYLIIYNLIMTLGWAYVFVLAYDKRYDLPNLWKHIELPLKIFQTGALLEVKDYKIKNYNLMGLF
jgi:hypothetical protein